MCRNIRTLYNYAPQATPAEVHAAALQYVRKVSGTTRPSVANQPAFDEAVAAIAHTTQHLLEALVTNAPPKDRSPGPGAVQPVAIGRSGSVIQSLHEPI